MTGLGGLFRDAGSPRGLLEDNAVPQAIGPAVEIIARLSSERNKLREEVCHLRDRLRKAPREGDLAQLRAERDALAKELAVLGACGGATRHDVGVASRSMSRRGSRPVGLPMTKLIERLERAIARIEAAPRDGQPAAVTPGSLRPVRRPAPRGGGMLAGLVNENVSLRSDAVPRTESPTETNSTTAAGGGGLLRGLFSQNLSLRGPGKST